MAVILFLPHIVLVSLLIALWIGWPIYFRWYVNKITKPYLDAANEAIEFQRKAYSDEYQRRLDKIT